VWLTGEEVRRVLEISVLLSQLLRNSYFLQVSGLRARYDPRRAILFRVPLRGTPIPTGRAVLDAHAIAADGSALPLERGDDRLYHVVTDYYVASFLPMVGRMLPRLALAPKDRHGQPLPTWMPPSSAWPLAS
jgi:5'-nucleotidase / UDP-sugar diphosphatase